jgi:hypothetical protein
LVLLLRASELLFCAKGEVKSLGAVKNIQHTVRYTELSPTQFKNFWRA